MLRPGVDKDMPVEKSAGAVIFYRTDKKFDERSSISPRRSAPVIEYLLLHYPSSAKAPREYWDFPKGHIEKGEKLEDAARREVEEETGLKDIEFIDGFKETIKYFFKFKGKNILKFVTFYLAETKTKKAKVSFEHLGFAWLPYEEALKQLTFKDAKEILKKANQFLRQHVASQ